VKSKAQRVQDAFFVHAATMYHGTWCAFWPPGSWGPLGMQATSYPPGVATNWTETTCPACIERVYSGLGPPKP
jgi:hypothetical protein